MLLLAAPIGTSCVVRGTATALAFILAGCGQILGVDAYRVTHDGSRGGGADSGKRVTPGEVTAFLGGVLGSERRGACIECIAGECSDAVNECVADAACGNPAKCMGECKDPACVVTRCPGAAVPNNPKFKALGACAKRACLDECEIGASWSCLKNYDWPATPTEPFAFPFTIDVFHAGTPLSFAEVKLCVRGNTCEGEYLLATATTDSLGQGEFQVKPWQYLGGHYVPDTTIRLPATSRTYAHQFEMNTPFVRPADRVSWNALTFETESNHFVYGTALDCRGTVMMAARDLVLVPSWPTPAVDLRFYWPDDPHATVEINTKTSLSGVFSVLHAGPPSDAGTAQLVPPGRYRIELQDHATKEVRAYHDLDLVAGENFGVGMFPLTSKQ